MSMSNQKKWFLEVHPETLAILNATQSESETWPQVEVNKEIVDEWFCGCGFDYQIYKTGAMYCLGPKIREHRRLRQIPTNDKQFVFEAEELDERNWVYDFGDCQWIKDFLEDTFDHTLVIASDDPELESFKRLHDNNVCKLWTLDHVGFEKFAELVYGYVASTVSEKTKSRVSLYSVECFEHGANSAIYVNPFGSSLE